MIRYHEVCFAANNFLKLAIFPSVSTLVSGSQLLTTFSKDLARRPQRDKIGSGLQRPKEGGGQAAVGGGADRVEVVQLDLVGFQSVRKYMAEVASKTTNQCIIFNDSGIAFHPRHITDDGK